MKNFTLNVFAPLMLVLLMGCSENPEPEVPPPTPPVDEPTDSFFNISVSDITFENGIVNVAPADKSTLYYVSIIEKTEYEKAGTDTDYISWEVSSMESYAEAQGATLQEFLKAMLVSGDHAEKYERKLFANTEYYAYAYGLDYKGNLTQGMEKVEFKTPVADPVKKSDCEFEFDIQVVTNSSFGFVVYPTDYELQYFSGGIRKADYLSTGGTEEAFIQYMVDKFTERANSVGLTLDRFLRSSLLSGAQIQYETACDPDTDYLAFALGFDSQGRVCTDLWTEEFHTEGFTTSDVAVHIKFDKFYDGDELAAKDEARFSKFKGKAYLPVYVTPEESVEEWWVMNVPTDILDMFSDAELTDIIMDNGAHNMEAVAIGCPWGESVLLSLATDEDDTPGEIGITPINLDKSKASPVSDVVNSAKANLYAAPMVDNLLKKYSDSSLVPVKLRKMVEEFKTSHKVKFTRQNWR